MTKRIFDTVVALFGLMLLSPILLVVAIGIKLGSNGPIFYRGRRVGKDGQVFRIYKFRTMVSDAERTGVSSTNELDTRVTPMGRLIRKYKLDEIPQLINVIKGDMSLVGPRPEVEKYVALYDSSEQIILSVRPGITDWSSIKFHNEGEIIAASGILDADEAYAKLIRPEKLRLQKKYVEERCFAVDIQIILDTIVTLFRTRAIHK